jgi:hypothetical protein
MGPPPSTFRFGRTFFMQQVIFHIGIQKTGTTALQNYLLDNKKVLSKLRVKPIVIQKNWINAHQYFYPELFGSEIRTDIVLRDFEHLLSDRSIDTLIISGEDMTGFMWNWEQRINKLSLLVNSANNFCKSVLIVCYFRRQDHAYEAIYQELSKRHISMTFDEFYKDNSFGIEHVDLNWHSRTKLIENTIPDCKTLFYLYELTNNDIVRHFNENLHLPRIHPPKKRKSGIPNRSLNHNAVALYNYVKKNRSKSDAEYFLKYLLNNSIFLKRKLERFMRYEQIEGILNQYHDTNKRLFDKLALPAFKWVYTICCG